MTDHAVPLRLPPAVTPDDLERALTAADPVVALRRLGDPLRLDLLFRLELRRRLRMGPARPARSAAGAHEEVSSVARLLDAAKRAAGRGVLPLSTLVDSRSTLLRLEDELHQSGAWSEHHPLWWQPLPAPNDLEELWSALEGVRSRLRQGAQASRPPQVTPSWRSWPSLLPATLTQRVAAELDGARRSQALVLGRGGVGADGRIVAARTDEVAHLSGLEPALLAHAPLLAVLVQWVRERLAPAVLGVMADPWGATLARRPATAMLARHGPGTRGYAPHYDNPGGESDNGRALTLVLYLHPPSAPCRGGELALWNEPAAPDSPPQTVFPHDGGLVAFASRKVLHEVRPVQPGPPRWSLVTWMKDDAPTVPVSTPEPTLADVMVAIDAPPLRRNTVAFHLLAEDTGVSRINLVRSTRSRRPMRMGVVATAAATEPALDRWIAHHLELGVAHLVVVLDGQEEGSEAETGRRLAGSYSRSRVTVWRSRRLAEERWLDLAERHGLHPLVHQARGTTSLQSVAARQTLNATAALEAGKTDELGGAPLDWLLHLDADELLHLEGAGRGGESLEAHLASASAAGWSRVRYLDHELLLPQASTGPALFKVNPLLAAARLGSTGWAAIEATLRDLRPRRPYFHGYCNGKAAVAVEAATAAAGVHGWWLRDSSLPDVTHLLAGPSILHLRLPSSESFCSKMLAAARGSTEDDGGLFEPSAVEQLALSLVHSASSAQWSAEEIRQRLTDLYLEVTQWSEAEQALLDEAGLLLSVDLRHLSQS